jgi:molybdopterin-guanine dinucleotide biosynthesis protein A
LELTVENSAAFILAGGRSSRMGRDKALITFDGVMLLEHLLRVCRQVSAAVRIVGAREKYGAFGETVEDIYPGRGTLGGIHAALSCSSTDLNLILAVDLPYIEAALLHYLLARAAGSDAMVTVPEADGRLQPLCAVYRPQFLIPAQQALEAGQNKVDVLFARVPIQVIPSEELAQHGFPAAVFANLNTPEDLARAARREQGIIKS